jgi:hypothetical protein
MSMYYFNLQDDDTVVDTDGTDFPDVGAARIHATGVARELTSTAGELVWLDHVSAGRAWHGIVFTHHVGFREWEFRKIN